MPMLRVMAHNPEQPGQEARPYIACNCMAEEDFLDECVLVSDKGIHRSIREVWGDEVLQVMLSHPDKFPAGSIPGPVDI